LSKQQFQQSKEQQPAAYSAAEALLLSTQLKGCSNAQERQQQRWSAALGLMHTMQALLTANVASASARPVDDVRWVVAGVSNAGHGVVPVALLLAAGPGGLAVDHRVDLILLLLDENRFPNNLVRVPDVYVQQFTSSTVVNFMDHLWVLDPTMSQQVAGTGNFPGRTLMLQQLAGLFCPHGSIK
jgi:hypothetical protein